VKFFVRVAIGLTLLGILLWRVEPGAILEMYADANIGLLAIACLFFAIDRLLMVFKWNLLLRSKDIRISSFTAIRHYMIGNLIGLFTPGAIGLDVYRVAALAGTGNTHDVAATAVLERVVGLGMLIVFLLGAFPFAGSHLPVGEDTLRWLAIGCVAGLVAIMVSFVPRANEWIIKFVPLQMLGKVGVWLQRLAESYNQSIASVKTLAWFTFWTMAEVFVSIVVVYFAALSIGVNESFTVFAVIVPVGFLVSRLPISLDGIGVSEAVYVVAFSALGYEGEVGLALALLIRMVRLVVAQIPATILLMLYGSAAGTDRPQETDSQ
jgi:uncharacterized protein (TIRG00374 family)